MRANIKITKNGMAKVTGDQLLPLSIVGSEDLEVILFSPERLYFN